jgi:hypothetical protein
LQCSRPGQTPRSKYGTLPVHCPPCARSTNAGLGSGACVILWRGTSTHPCCLCCPADDAQKAGRKNIWKYNQFLVEGFILSLDSQQHKFCSHRFVCIYIFILVVPYMLVSGTTPRISSSHSLQRQTMLLRWWKQKSACTGGSTIVGRCWR